MPSVSATPTARTLGAASPLDPEGFLQSFLWLPNGGLVRLRYDSAQKQFVLEMLVDITTETPRELMRGQKMPAVIGFTGGP